MSIRVTLLAAGAAAIGAAPAAAQYNPYPNQPGYNYPAYPGQAYPQPYPGYGQPGYGQPAYGQGYAQNPVGAIIDQLLGNRYNVTDRQAVSRCASAVMAQASAQYGNGYNPGYNRGYSNMRVTAITDVQRRNNGLRVSGLLGSGYGGQYGYQNRGYGGGDLSFRCNVDYRGAVTGIRIRRNNDGYRRD